MPWEYRFHKEHVRKWYVSDETRWGLHLVSVRHVLVSETQNL